jgi:hypothetical protein
MTIESPSQEWIERATAFVKADHAIGSTFIHVLARELQSSFDQGVERERERIRQNRGENGGMVCPFCLDFDFDAIGLKAHLTNRCCAAFDSTSTLQEERARRALTPSPTEGERG